MSNKNLVCFDMGLTPYAEGLRAQEACISKVKNNGELGFVLLLEHPSTLTLGKNSQLGHIISNADLLKKQGITTHHCDRGGEVTAHNPGQLVAYPIIPISVMGLTVKKYVRALEQSIIELLGHYDLNAHTDPEHPGVWIAKDKVCALGVRISQRISSHGLALNISNNLDIFQNIVPCGIIGRGITSMNKLLQTPLDHAKIRRYLAEKLSTHLGYQSLELHTCENYNQLMEKLSLYD